MCCNVMLSVINIVVCLTAPTDQGNKDYTHTDIRVVYNRVLFGLTTNTEDSFSERNIVYTPASEFWVYIRNGI